MSHPLIPSLCRSCHWALEGLKRPPDPTPAQIAEMDAFLGNPRRRRLIDDTRGKSARAWMDKIHPHLSPPITRGSQSFWEDYGEQMERLLSHKGPQEQAYLLSLLSEFYPFGPRYV